MPWCPGCPPGFLPLGLERLARASYGEAEDGGREEFRELLRGLPSSSSTRAQPHVLPSHLLPRLLTPEQIIDLPLQVVDLGLEVRVPRIIAGSWFHAGLIVRDPRSLQRPGERSWIDSVAMAERLRAAEPRELVPVPAPRVPAAFPPMGRLGAAAKSATIIVLGVAALAWPEAHVRYSGASRFAGEQFERDWHAGLIELRTPGCGLVLFPGLKGGEVSVSEESEHCFVTIYVRRRDPAIMLAPLLAFWGY